MKYSLIAVASIAILVSAHAQADTTKIRLDIESTTFVNGSQLVELQDNVPQTIVFSKPGDRVFDKRCAMFGIVSPDGTVPTNVEVRIVAKRFDDGTVLAHGELKANKVGKVQETQVAINGDSADCPSRAGVLAESNVKVTKGKPQVLYSGWDSKNEATIDVRLTVQ